MGYEPHKYADTIVISVYNSQSLDTWNWTLPDAVFILRDQAESAYLCQMNYIAAQMNIPKEPDVIGMGIRCQIAGWYKLGSSW